jgi:hypothetical protein
MLLQSAAIAGLDAFILSMNQSAMLSNLGLRKDKIE